MIRRPTLRRSAIITLEVIGGAVAALSILVMLAFWRLTTGPIQIDFLRPYTEAALEEAFGGVQITLERTEIVWEKEDRTLALRASGVRASETGGGMSGVQVPTMLVRLSIKALTRGLVAPVEIVIIEPAITAIRSPDGEISFGGRSTEDAQSRGEALQAVIDELGAPPDRTRTTGYLERIRIRHASIVFEDQALDTSWFIPQADILLRRGERSVRGRGSLELDLDGTPLFLTVEGIYRTEEGRATATASFSGLDPSAIAAKVPALDLLSAMKLPLSGTITVEGEPDGRVRTAELRLLGGSGTLDLPGVYEHALPVRSLSASAFYRADNDTLMLPDFSLDFGTAGIAGPRLSLSGSVADLGDPQTYAINGEVVLRDMPTTSLPFYWPKMVGRNARDWVLGNLEGGMVPRATITLQGRVSRQMPMTGTLDQFDGGFDFQNVRAHYLRPLPPVEKTAGKARFGPGRFTVEATGKLMGTDVGPAKIDLTGLDGDTETAAIEVVTRGPLKDVITILDRKPLDYASALGLKPNNVAGLAAARLVFEFPLLNNLGLEQVKIAAAANISKAGLPGILLDKDFSEGDLALTLDGRGMTIEGKGRFDTVPITLNWREYFQRGSQYSRRILAKGVVDDAARRRLDLDFAPYLTGPVSADIDYRQTGAGVDAISAVLDLQQASLALAEVAWRKPVQTAGTARLDITIPPKGEPSIDRFTIAASDLAASGSAAFERDFARLKKLDFAEFRLGRSNLAGTIVQRPDRTLVIDVKGAMLDLEPLLADTPESETEDGSTDPGRPIRFTGRFERVLFEEGRLIDGVDATLQHDGRTWNDIKITGRLAEAGRFDLVASPRAGGTGHDFILVSDDAGSALRSFGLYDTMVGGRLRADGTGDFDNLDQPIHAALDINDFRIVRASALAEVLRASSSRDIQSALAGEGIQFARLTADLQRTPDLIRIRNARAVGAALALSIDGTVQPKSDTIDVAGLVVPAYQLSRAIGSIPIIGPLITGGRDEGLLATEFRLQGNIDAPRVTINPLTTLAPGFLRDLFRIFTDSSGANSNTRPSQ
ncbi:MAG: AsmA-like C-terminal domain-containing protein [Alphaproteobacteria bacterium]|nr:AsmA-like C-terminal domain-containing protein [Alphaproteobacteria bacterium]